MCIIHENVYNCIQVNRFSIERDGSLPYFIHFKLFTKISMRSVPTQQ